MFSILYVLTTIIMIWVHGEPFLLYTVDEEEDGNPGCYKGRVLCCVYCVLSCPCIIILARRSINTSGEVVFKLGDTSCFNQHPWMHLNWNTILYT